MDCSEEETGDPGESSLTEYERKRLQRILENDAVLAALDLPALAASLRETPAVKKKQRNHAVNRAAAGSTPRRSARLRTSEGERKVMRDLSSSSGDESDSSEREHEQAPAAQKGDAEYEPSDEDEGEEEAEAAEEEEGDRSASESELAASPDELGQRRSGSKKSRQTGNGRNGKAGTARQLWTAHKISQAPTVPKGKKRQSAGKQKLLQQGASPNELASPGQLLGHSASIEDSEEQELQKALAMSMGVSVTEGNGGSMQNGSVTTPCRDTAAQTPSRADGQSAKSKRQPKKSRRVELGLTEDDIVKCFFLLDERVSGNVTLRDMQRVAGAHDFTWSEEELLDMINLFNANNNGRLNLEEFRDIAMRCNSR